MKEITIHSSSFETVLNLPWADQGVRAGFPSPAQDYMDKSLDLNRDLIAHPAATFYATVDGDSMGDAGIDPGDIVVIDRALDPVQDDIVVAFINGEFTMKYLDLSNKDEGEIWLHPGNEAYPSFRITEGDDTRIWGVVTNIIKRVRKKKRMSRSKRHPRT